MSWSHLVNQKVFVSWDQFNMMAKTISNDILIKRNQCGLRRKVHDVSPLPLPYIQVYLSSITLPQMFTLFFSHLTITVIKIKVYLASCKTGCEHITSINATGYKEMAERGLASMVTKTIDLADPDPVEKEKDTL
jgi:hypothetical protein